MIGERLAELRKDKGWKQEDLAHQLGLTYHTVSSYERNRSEPNNEILIKIAELFDVSTDYLLGLVRERFSYKRNVDSIELPSGITEDQRVQILKFIEFVVQNKEE